jgi:sterol-4alpha-carboxylate 3-dehydrogenase (decarboxylating)
LAFQAGDLCDEKDLAIACEGVWAVLHVASPPPTSVDKSVFMKVNVGGTEKLLAECRKAGINRFVFTSSASLVFEGRDQMNYKESDGTPSVGGDDYIHSKLLAEQLVITSNDRDLWTVALRPHAIFGPRDTSFLPRMIQAAKGVRFLLTHLCL